MVGFVGRVVVSTVEDALEVGEELLLAAHQLGQPFDVVWHVECVVPGVAFVEAGRRLEVLALFGVEWCQESPVGKNGTERAVFL